MSQSIYYAPPTFTQSQDTANAYRSPAGVSETTNVLGIVNIGMNGAGASSGSGFPNNFSPSDKNFSNKPSTSNSSSSYLSDKPETEASGMGTNAIANLEKMASLKFEATAQNDVNSVLPSIPPNDMAQYNHLMGNFNNYLPYYSNPMASSAALAAYYHPMTYGFNPAYMNGVSGKKSGRMTYNRHQTSILESKFRETTYVSKKQREELHKYTGLSDRQIKIWFQNRRMKAKKEKDRTHENGEQCVPVPPSGPKLPRDTCITNGSDMNNPLNQQVGSAEYPGRSLKTEDAERGSETACTSSSSISSGPIPQEFNFPWATPMTVAQEGKPDMMNFANHTITSPALQYPYMPVYPTNYSAMYNGYNTTM